MSGKPRVWISPATFPGITELALMKPLDVPVNVARGGSVDDAAQARALRERRLAAAALDVFEGESSVHPGLLPQDNVLLSPHSASPGKQTRCAITAPAVDNVLGRFGHGAHAGHPQGMINSHVLA